MNTKAITTETTTSVLLEVALKADQAQRLVQYLTTEATTAAATLARGGKVYHTSDVTRAAAEYATAVTELNQTVIVAGLFFESDSPELHAALRGMDALQELLNN